jgi:Amt family ammonium transporter
VHRENRGHAPANVTYVLLGTGMLWFGWFGFNCGSALGANETAALAFVTTNTASATAMVAWLLLDVVKGAKASALGASVGAVVGLVAITPAAGYVNVQQSIAIGAAAGLVCNYMARWRAKTRIDDTLDVFPCHGVGGVVGVVATGVFAGKVGLVYGSTTTFLHHLAALFIVGAFSFGGAFVLYRITDKIIPMRVRDEEEKTGLDRTQHDEGVAEPHDTVFAHTKREQNQET